MEQPACPRCHSTDLNKEQTFNTVCNSCGNAFYPGNASVKYTCERTGDVTYQDVTSKVVTFKVVKMAGPKN